MNKQFYKYQTKFYRLRPSFDQSGETVRIKINLAYGW